MAVDLNEILTAQLGANLDAAGKAHVQSMDLQAKVSIKKYDELDPVQAIALVQANKSLNQPTVGVQNG